MIDKNDKRIVLEIEISRVTHDLLCKIANYYDAHDQLFGTSDQLGVNVNDIIKAAIGFSIKDNEELAENIETPITDQFEPSQIGYPLRNRFKIILKEKNRTLTWLSEETKQGFQFQVKSLSY